MRRRPSFTSAGPDHLPGEIMRRVPPPPDFVVFERDEVEDSLPACFERQVARDPDHLAVDDDGQLYTYAEFNQMANRIAWAIMDHLGDQSGETQAASADTGSAQPISHAAQVTRMITGLDPGCGDGWAASSGRCANRRV